DFPDTGPGIVRVVVFRRRRDVRPRRPYRGGDRRRCRGGGESVASGLPCGAHGATPGRGERRGGSAVTQRATTAHRSAEQIGHTELGPRELPAIGELSKLGVPNHVDTALSNGLRVVAVRKSNVPMVETRLSIPFGGDSPEHTATAEVLAETVLTGTARRDRVGIDTELALIGGELNTVVDPEHLVFAGGCLATGLPTLLDVLADALCNASYPDSEVARESARLVERLTVARTQPGVLAREALQRRRYGDHPAAREVPQAEYVAAVDVSDVRALHSRAVIPRGSTLV